MEFTYSLCGVIAGIICADVELGRNFIILIGALFMLFLFISITSKRINTPLVVLIIFSVLGYYSGNYALNSDNSQFKDFASKEVRMIGRIIDLPSKNSENYSYIAKIYNIKDDINSYNVNENIRLTTKTKLNYDDVFVIKSTPKEIPLNSNEFGFNSKIYYKSQGISYKTFVEECEMVDYKLVNLDLHSMLTSIRSKMYQTINKHYSGDDAALLCAISIGNKTGFSDEFNKILERTGVKRCLYPAFIQIMLFMFFLSLIQTKVPQKIRFIMLAVFLIIFGTANSTNPVFVKSAFYIAIFYASKQFLGFALKQDIIFIVIAGMLVANPLLLYNGGFVCSSVANILIIYFLPEFRKKFKFIKSGYIKNTIGIGIICSVGLLPLSAYYFNGIATYHLLATLFLIPLTAILFILSPILVVLLNIFGSAPFISDVVDFILYIYKGVPYFIDKLPKEYITMGVPGILVIIAFYLLVYSFYKYLDKHNFYVPLVVGCLILCYVSAKEIQRMNTAEITFVNVGQGDAALVSAPYRYNIIIDGGGGYDFAKTEEEKAASENEYNIGEEVFVPYLQTHGISHIDAALVSHYHKDHVEGIVAAIEMMDVDTVYMPDLLPDNEWRIKIEQAAQKHGTKIEYIAKDSQISYGGFIIKIFYPTKTALLTEDENNTSLLYKVNYGKTSTLFTGDMTALYEASMVYSNKNIECDILKVAHHGSAYSTCKEFVDATSPEYAVISLGENNPYGFPRKEVLDNLANIPIYRTDINGDIRFTINQDGIKSIHTLR